MSSIVMITRVHHDVKGSCVAIASLNNPLHQKQKCSDEEGCNMQFFFYFFFKPLKQGKLVRVPLLISIGLAPLLILSNPSLAMARARTVAQVVPSPASSLVLLATSWTSLAPMFWYLSCRSMALATVTPSFVILGLPQLCSIMTFLPCKLKIYQICDFFVNVYHLWIHARI